MRLNILLLFFFCAFGFFSCSKESRGKPKVDSSVYIDSMSFNHYKKSSLPYLLSSQTYAFNDSMSQILDTLNLQKLVEMNSTDRSYSDPLSYTSNGDTLFVDLIYSPGYGRFPFGEIRSQHDSIFIKLSGDVFKALPKISEEIRVPYRYFKSEFKILVDSTKKYNIFFRHNDSFDAKH